MVKSVQSTARAPLLVVLGDGRRLVRTGLSRLLAGRPSLVVLAEAASTDQLLLVTAATHPDVVMLDLSLPHDALAAVRALRATGDGPEVLLYGVPKDSVAVVSALQAGAKGVLDADADVNTIVIALARVAQGEVALSPQLANHLATDHAVSRQLDEPRADPVLPILTERESQVLNEIASGSSNRKAAAALGMSPNTVRAHLRSISRKLAAQNRLHLVGEALRAGLLSDAADAKNE